MDQDTPILDGGEGEGFEDGEVDACSKEAGDGKKKGTSQRTVAYRNIQELVIYLSCINISQDPISGAEQKVHAYWRKTTQEFHEHRQLTPFRIHSICNQLSLQKRWAYIQQEINKFCAEINHVIWRKVSVLGFVDVVRARTALFMQCKCLGIEPRSNKWCLCKCFEPWSFSRHCGARATTSSIIGMRSRTSKCKLGYAIYNIIIQNREASVAAAVDGEYEAFG
jgi:hypothetical protein